MSQTQFRSHIVMVVVQASSYSSDQTPSLGPSVCHGCGPREDKKCWSDFLTPLSRNTKRGPSQWAISLSKAFIYQRAMYPMLLCSNTQLPANQFMTTFFLFQIFLHLGIVDDSWVYIQLLIFFLNFHTLMPPFILKPCMFSFFISLSIHLSFLLY